MKAKVLVGLIMIQTLGLVAQRIERVDPPYWWRSHPVDTIELVVSGEELADQFSMPKAAGYIFEQAVLKKGRYAHLKIALSSGYEKDHFTLKSGKATYTFELKERDGYKPQGLSAADLVYLITPDRFRNGEPANDDVEGMRERGVNREEVYARHGGDLEGIGHGLDYIKSLGASAIWINPVLENDMARDSYHGYAITDHYAVDARFGGNAALKTLVADMHASGLKHVADVVYNHWGSEHYLHRDLPDSGMVHWTSAGEIPYSNFRFTSMTDPHRMGRDSTAFQDGWFAGAMPDINQDHPVSAAYMKYATLWYVEEFAVDALRCDTYAFSSPVFLTELNRLLKKAYPELFIFGETWAYSEASQAYFAPNHLEQVAPTGLDAVTDFTYWRALHELYGADESEQWGWHTGAGAMYYRLASDLLYSRPEALVTFIDNHDDGRFLGQFHGNRRKLRSALTLLYFGRGIPVLYYGTEQGLQGFENHGAIREDMPFFEGDFPDYSINSEELLLLCQELGRLRREWGPIKSLKQAVPKDGWLQWELATEKGTLHLVMNATDRSKREHPWGKRFDVSSGQELIWTSEPSSNAVDFEPWEVRVYHIYRP